jgi:hypothetical protein
LKELCEVRIVKGNGRGDWHCGEFCLTLLVFEWCVSKRSVHKSKQKTYHISVDTFHGGRSIIIKKVPKSGTVATFSNLIYAALSTAT